MNTTENRKKKEEVEKEEKKGKKKPLEEEIGVSALHCRLCASTFILMCAYLFLCGLFCGYYVISCISLYHISISYHIIHSFFSFV